MNVSELIEKGLIEKSTFQSTAYLGKRFVELETGPDGKILNNEKNKEIREKFTLNVEFDFSDVSLEEILNQSVSTTTFNKMLYNNISGKWDESETLEHCSETYKVNVREMLDNRKRIEMTDEEKFIRATKKAIQKGGLTKAEMMELIKKM
jgi:hypothetical protein